MITAPTTPVKYKPLWSRLTENRQAKAMSKLRDRLDRHQTGGARARLEVRAEILRTYRDPSRELRQMPAATHWAVLLGYYTTAASLGMAGLELSVSKICDITGLSRTYVNFMHRWLVRIGWLHVDERRGVAEWWDEAKQKGVLRAVYKSSRRVLSFVAHEAMATWDKVKEKLSVMLRGKKGVLNKEPLDLPQRLGKGDKAPPRRGCGLTEATLRASVDAWRAKQPKLDPDLARFFRGRVPDDPALIPF